MACCCRLQLLHSLVCGLGALAFLVPELIELRANGADQLCEPGLLLFDQAGTACLEAALVLSQCLIQDRLHLLTMSLLSGQAGLPVLCHLGSGVIQPLTALHQLLLMFVEPAFVLVVDGAKPGMELILQLALALLALL